MRPSTQIVADPSGLWIPPKGWQVGDRPADVVAWNPDVCPRFWVRGSRPSAVAANLAHLWRWPFRTLRSPSEAAGVALGCFWPYGDEVASDLLKLVGSDPLGLRELDRETLVDLAQESSGGAVFWRIPAGRPEHLAGLMQALFDWNRGEPSPSWTPLAQALCLLWEREVGPKLGPLYRYEQLSTLLRAWVLDDHGVPGLRPAEIPGIKHLLRPFPAPPPRLALQWVYEAWRRSLSRADNDHVFDAITRLEPTRHVAVGEAARALAEMVTVLGTDQVPPQAMAWLERTATELQDVELSGMVQGLRERRRPPAPPDLPNQDADMETLLQWGERYVFHRMWERQQAVELSPESADQCRRFGHSYLRAYQEGVGNVRVRARSTMIWERVRDLLEDGQAVLWAVVDGLPFVYWPVLQQLLVQERSGLALAEDPRACGAVIPTDTHYAKWALYTGKLPGAAERIGEAHPRVLQDSLGPWANNVTLWTDRGEPLSRGAGAALSGMQPGDCVVLDFLALDRQYSQHTGDPGVLHNYLLKSLEVIAEQILMALELVPAALKEKYSLVISADHGAVLDPLPVLQDNPIRGRPRGRLASGLGANPGDPWTALPLQECGLPDDEPLSVCLGPNRFGAQGVPTAPICGQHGSLWPDEVLVPLAVLQRSEGGLQALRIEVAEGKAAAGAPGTVLLQLRNPNPVLAATQITVDLMAFGERERHLSFDRLEGAQSSPLEKIAIEKWPSQLPAAGAPVGKIRYRVGNVEQTVDVVGNFHAETLYDSAFDSLFRLEQQ